MKRIAFLFALGVAVACGGGGVGGEKFLLSTDMVFVSNRDGNAEIYFYDHRDGSEVRLTNNAAVDDDPAISPDGKQVLFVSERDGNKELYLVKVDGTGLKRLTNNTVPDYLPCWHPNGTLIAYVRILNGSDRIFRMNIDGTSNMQLFGESAFDPQFSRDGSLLAYIGDTAGGRDLFTCKLDGTDPKRITNTPNGTEYVPCWSPDGTKIAYGYAPVNGGGEETIDVINVDGTGHVTLVDSQMGYDDWPVWTADGQYIVYTNAPGANPFGDIWAVSPSGGDVHLVVFGTGMNPSVP